MKSRLVCVLLAVLALTACATSNVKKDYKLSHGTGKGLVVGSITYSGSHAGYSVFYRKSPDMKRGWFESGKSVVLIPYFPPGDFESYGVKGNLIASELPEGEYEIFSWRVGSGSVSVMPRQSLSSKFTVKEGKAVYIGNFHFLQTSRMGLAVTGVNVIHKDMMKRDAYVFIKKYPQMADVKMEASIESGLNAEGIGGSNKTTYEMPMVVPVVK